MNPVTLRLEVRPGRALSGAFVPPGDKSISHRAYMLALAACGTSRVTGANPGDDCARTLACIRALGAGVRDAPGGFDISGRDFDFTPPADVLDCGNSGTALRLLAGLVAGRRFHAVLDGDASLRTRPVARVIEPLARMGAVLRAREGDRFPPLEIDGRPLKAIDYDVPVASAQVLSCVILAGLQATGTTSVAIPGPARDHTETMLEAFGVQVEVIPSAAAGRRVRVQGGARLRAADVRVPGDPSAAAFFLAAAAAAPGGRVTARGVSLNPTRTAFFDVLEEMGARVERQPADGTGSEPYGDVTIEGPARLTSFDIPVAWLPRMIDEVPAWTLAACAADGCSALRGASELRLKESDRIAVLATQLARLGADVRERDDGLEITGSDLRGGHVDAAGDHRIAMALGLMGLRSREPVVVDDASSIATSYPGFAGALRALGGDAEENRGRRA